MKSNNPRYLSVFFLKNEMLTLSPESIISPMRISTWQEIKIDKYTGENDFTVTNTLFFVFVFVFFCNYRGIKWSVPARLSRIAVGAYSSFFGKKSPANLGYSPSRPLLYFPSPPPPLLSVPPHAFRPLPPFSTFRPLPPSSTFRYVSRTIYVPEIVTTWTLCLA